MHRVKVQGRDELPWNTSWNTSWWRHQFKPSQNYARAHAHDTLTCLLRSASFYTSYLCDCGAQLLQQSSSGLHNRHISSSNMPTEVVVGLGDPIVDVLVPVSHADFDELGLQRGGSTPLDSDSINRLMSQLPEDAPRNKYVLLQHKQKLRRAAPAKFVQLLMTLMVSQYSWWFSCECDKRSSKSGAGSAVS